MANTQLPASNLDAPITLRRSKRRSSVLDSPETSRRATDTSSGHSHQHISSTPARRSKRVRFSDSALPAATSTQASTGITPHLRRSSLGTSYHHEPSTPSTRRFSAEIQFTPFRQVLDERCKRRIRRNGLSEEMNDYEADKKSKTKLEQDIVAKDTELKRLRAELDEARSKAARVNSSYTVSATSQGRVDEVEAELEALRQSFALEGSTPVQSWSHIPTGCAGPSSEGGDTIQIYEDDDADQAHNKTLDPDSLTMGLELEAARQAKKSFLGSFRDTTSFANMNFADSPARRQHQAVGTSPRTPKSFYHDLSKQLKAATHRAEDAELALKSLETEIASLGFGFNAPDALGAVTTIADHFRQVRLELERAAPGETVIGFENDKVFTEVISKLHELSSQLQSREAELRAARDQQHNLKNNFEKAIVAAEKATSRVKDLELSIDSTAEEMLHLRIRAKDLEKDLVEKEKDISSLTSALNKYRSDVSRLETLITNLETSHTSSLMKDQMISDLDAKAAAETRGRRAAETSAVARLAKISELESALSTAKSHADNVEEAMSKLQSHIESSKTSHAEEVGSLNCRISSLSTALASANAEVEKLKITKTRLEDRVRQEVEQGARTVEAIQADLIKSVAKTYENRKSYIRAAKVRTANFDLQSDELESDSVEPLTPASLVRFAEFSEEFSPGADERERTRPELREELPATVEIGRGLTPKDRSRSAERRSLLRVRTGILKKKPRRKYDSGVGLSSDVEPESDAEMDSRDESGYGSGSLTPDLDSEPDLEKFLESRRRDVEMAA